MRIQTVLNVPGLLRATALLTAVTALPGQRDLAKALPAHTWAYAADAGLDATAKVFHDAKLVDLGRNLLGADGWQQLQDLARDAAGRDFDEALGVFARVGLNVDRVRALLAGPFAFAVGRLTFMGETVIPSLALIADVKDVAAVQACLTDLERLIGQAQQGITMSDATVAGVACRRLTLPGAMGSIVHAMVDGTWIATNSEGFLADSIAALRGQTANLATNASLARGRAQMHGTRLLELFVNVQQFSASLTPLLPYEMSRIGAAIGASDLPDLYLGAAHDGKSSCDVMHVLLPGSKSGMLKAALSTGASNAAARWVKPSTSLFASMRIDGRAAGKAFDQLLDVIPAAAAKEMRKEMSREFTRELGMSPQNLIGVLSTLGSEISIAIDTPRPVPPYVTFAVFVELADVEHATSLLEQLAASGQLGKVESETENGQRLWSTELEVAGVEILDSVGLRMSPTWGIRDGWLVVANFKNVAKRLLHEGPLATGSLADDPRFRTAAKAADGAAMFLTARFNPLLQNYWGLATAGIQWGSDRVGIETDEVPNSDDVAGAIDDVVFAVRADEHGFVLRQHCPIGLGTMMAASAAGLEWFLKQAPRKIY